MILLKKRQVQQNFNANIQSRKPSYLPLPTPLPIPSLLCSWKSETNAPSTMLDRAMCEDRGCEGGVLGILEVGAGGGGSER